MSSQILRSQSFDCIFREYLGSSLCEKKISEFYRADLEKAYPEDRPLFSIIDKEAKGGVKKLVVFIDGMDLIEGTGYILHIKLHMW